MDCARNECSQENLLFIDDRAMRQKDPPIARIQEDAHQIYAQKMEGIHELQEEAKNNIKIHSPLTTNSSSSYLQYFFFFISNYSIPSITSSFLSFSFIKYFISFSTHLVAMSVLLISLFCFFGGSVGNV